MEIAAARYVHVLSFIWFESDSSVRVCCLSAESAKPIKKYHVRYLDLETGRSQPIEKTIKAVDQFDLYRLQREGKISIVSIDAVKGDGEDPSGYRVGLPDVTRAADVIHFEVTQLNNTHLLRDAAEEFELPAPWDEQAVTAEVEKRFGPDAVAMWLTRDPDYARERYGPGVVYRVQIPVGAVVISDLGSDGQLWVWRKENVYKFEEPATLKTEISDHDSIRFLTNVFRCLNTISDDLYIIIKPQREGLIFYVTHAMGWGYCFIPSTYFSMYDFSGNEARFIDVVAQAFERVLARMEREERVYFETDWNRIFFSTRDRETRMFDLKVDMIETDDSMYQSLKNIAGMALPSLEILYARTVEDELSDAVRDLNTALGRGKFSDGGLKLDAQGLRGSWANHEWISSALDVYGYVSAGEGTPALVLEAPHGNFHVVLQKDSVQTLSSCLSSLRRIFGKSLVVNLGKWQDMLMLTIEEKLTVVLAFKAESWPDEFEWEKPQTPDVEFAVRFKASWDKFTNMLSEAESREMLSLTYEEASEIRARIEEEAKGLIKQVRDGALGSDEAYTRIKKVLDEETAKLKPAEVTAPPEAAAPTVYVKVLILQDVSQFVGSDMKTYGPYYKGEVREVPKANADQLVTQGLASYDLVPTPPTPSPPAAAAPASAAAPAPVAVASREEVYGLIDDVLNEWIPQYVEGARPGLSGNLHYDAPEFEAETLVRFTAAEVKRKYADDIQRRKEDEYRHYMEIADSGKPLVLEHVPTVFANFAADLVTRLRNQLLDEARVRVATARPAPPPSPAPARAPKELTRDEVARLEDVFKAAFMHELGRVPRDVMSEFRLELDTVKTLPYEDAVKVIERLAMDIVTRERERPAAERPGARAVARVSRVPQAGQGIPEGEMPVAPAVPPAKAEPPAVPLDMMAFPRRISSAEGNAFWDAFVYAMYELKVDPQAFVDRFRDFADAWYSNWFSALRAFEGIVQDIKTGKGPRYYPRPPIWHNLPRDAILHLLATKVYKSMDQLIAALNLHGVYVEPEEVRQIVKEEWAKTPRDSWLEITPKEYLSETLAIPIEELPG